MHQQPRAGPHMAQVAQQIVGGQALQQQRSGGVVFHCRGQAQHPTGRYAAHAAVGAGHGAQVGDAVAGHHVADAAADIEHRAGSFHARHAGRVVRHRQHRRYPAAAQVDVDEVHADGALADAHLAFVRRRCIEILRLQLVRPAVAAQRHAACRHAQCGGHRRAAGRAQVAAFAQVAAQVLEAGFVDASGHHLAQLGFHAGRCGEARFPVPEGALAVGHRLERHRGHVALQRDRGFDDAVGALVVAVVQRQQLFADAVAVLQVEVAHAAHLVAAFVALDAALVDNVVPLIMAVEVADHRPDALDWRVDDRGADDALKHQRRAKWRFSASKPVWNTPAPIRSVSSRSRPSSQSNSALHSAKLRLPSVMGVSFSVAT